MLIRTNISSLWVIANQDRNLTRLNNVLCRLATGLRINKASDDAAGLAISEKLRVQVRGTSQAIRNVQDFQSLCKIEDGTLETANELLQRIRELCVQAASDTLTQTERGLIKTEVDEIMNELNRIGTRNAWLNTYPLDGTFDRPEVVAEGSGGAIPSNDTIQIFDAGAFQKYANRPVRITVLQDAATQELDTVALRSSHIQETLTGVSGRMTSRISITGTTAVSAPLTANFTSTANNPVDAVYRLVRAHDGVVIDPSDYQISTSLPIPELTSFQATITDPSVTTFSATGAKFTTNATTGKARLGGGTGTILTRVQSAAYAERFLSDGDGLVTVSKNGVIGISQVQIYSGGSWITVNESTLGVEGDVVYAWDGAQSVQVGIKQADGTILPAGPNDIWVTATMNSPDDLAEFSSANNGDLTYQWDGNHIVTVGRKDGATLLPGRYVIFVDYQAQENQYTLTYDAYNKYQLTAGVKNSSGLIQFAQDLYAGTDIPADLGGSKRMEVRIDGNAPEQKYRFYSTYLNKKNVIIFNTGTAIPGTRGTTGPLSGSVITVDYATPTGTPVDWTMPTLGEDTMEDGAVANNEATASDGIFNDFWTGTGATSLTVEQPNRNRTMTFSLNPRWTVQDFIDAFNRNAQSADLEAEAYWDGGAQEVRIRPGTSGWKERPTTGWDGSLYALTMEAQTIGPGSTGDLTAAQNSISANGAAPTESIIQISLDDTGEVLVAAHASSSNQHDIAALGISVAIRHDADAGAFSVLNYSNRYIQAGANAGDENRLEFTIPGITPDILGIDTLSVSTQEYAVNSINLVDEAMKRVTTSRVYFGSLINRTDSILNNLMTDLSSHQAAESIIRDADYATEATALAKMKIIQQASNYYLAQSNLIPSMMLRLL